MTAAPWRLARAFPDGYRVLVHEGPRERSYEPPAAGSPGFREVSRGGWRVAASRPGASRAVDGDPDTSWEGHPEWQRPGEFFRVRLPEPRTLSRVSLQVAPPFFQFPTALRLETQAEGEPPRAVPYDAEAAYDRLFARLLSRPLEATLEIDFQPTMVRVVQLSVSGADGFRMPWTIAELRLYEPATAADR